MNSVVLTGHLARDPELSYTPNTQTAACRITLAVDKPKKNGEDQGADFIKVIVWGKQAENCNTYLSKGKQVAVKGRINTGSYKARDGQTVYTTDVVAEHVEFLGTRGENSRSNASSQQNGTTHREVPQNQDFADTGFTTTGDIPPWA